MKSVSLGGKKKCSMWGSGSTNIKVKNKEFLRWSFPPSRYLNHLLLSSVTFCFLMQEFWVLRSSRFCVICVLICYGWLQCSFCCKLLFKEFVWGHSPCEGPKSLYWLWDKALWLYKSLRMVSFWSSISFWFNDQDHLKPTSAIVRAASPHLYAALLSP